MDPASLLGVWKLVSFEEKDSEGNITYPFGEDAVGYYLFTSSGYGSVCLMKRDRSAFASGDIFCGTADEFIDAGIGYISYAGRYEVKGEQIVLHAEVAFFPNWVGMDQIRFTAMEDDRLILSARPALVSGRQQT